MAMDWARLKIERLFPEQGTSFGSLKNEVILRKTPNGMLKPYTPIKTFENDVA